MPSESELSSDFGVSRATVRTVLAKLAVNGLILRKQGDGTYINSRVEKTSAHLGNVWDFVCLIESNGFSPSIQFISSEVRTANDQEAQMLSIEHGDQLLSLQRLFTADGTPVILTENVFPHSLVQEPIDHLNESLQIRDFLVKYLHQEIAFVITDIHATRAGKTVSDLLMVSPETVLLALEVSFFNKDCVLLSLGTNYFNDSILNLSLVQAWTNTNA
jgi:GntR family transcriptional regulator